MQSLLLAISLAAFLQADVISHFKKAEGKAGHHAMPSIDFIYMINLDHRPEKWLASIEKLAPFAISPYRFSAVDGWELDWATINDLGVLFGPKMKGGFWGTYYRRREENELAVSVEREGQCQSRRPFQGDFSWESELIQTVGRIYFSHCLSPGAIGIALSHLSVLHDAALSGYETIWVMEDDIEVIRDPRILSEWIGELDLLTEKKWDILFTDLDTKNNEGERVCCLNYAKRPNYTPSKPYHKFAEVEVVGSHFRRIGARYGAYSMILRRSGIQKLLDFFCTYQLFLPYDMEYTLPAGIQLYTVLEEVVSTAPKSPSDNF